MELKLPSAHLYSQKKNVKLIETAYSYTGKSHKPLRAALIEKARIKTTKSLKPVNS